MFHTPQPYRGLRFVALAHRGGAELPGLEGRENTVAAFQAAVALGYDCLETDVRGTADGQVMVFHDADTARLTGVPGRIERRTKAEVDQLRVGGEAIPSFDELLEAFPGQRFNVDLKTDNAVQPLASLIARHRAQERVLVTSFAPIRLARFRAVACGRVATGVSWPGIAWNRFGRRGAWPVGIGGQAFQVPVRQRLGQVNISLLNRRLIDNAHRAGRSVHVWTVNDAATMEAVIAAGVDGIITDRPDILKTVLQDHDLWEGSHD
ncbi:MAG: glycerophosphodiester phosphodiesterase [Propionibacteriaceae bacterium]|jgi:glycerophosphoryl diester phosphodiesterase|nr:glycerophosphodiester phosphodiesterase [Propionibacteriaceae bacterium]